MCYVTVYKRTFGYTSARFCQTCIRRILDFPHQGSRLIFSYTKVQWEEMTRLAEFSAHPCTCQVSHLLAASARLILRMLLPKFTGMLG